MGKAVAAIAAAAVVAVAACTEELPSGPDDSQLPTEPVTVSLQLPWDEFGADLRVYGGYGLVDNMASTFVARAYDGVEARTLVRFDTIPLITDVYDPNGNLRQDTITYIDAYIVLQVDTAASTSGTVQLAYGHTQENWDTRTATWTNAIDRLGETPVPWTTPGGGVVTPLATWEFDPGVIDSAQFFLDTATIRQWREGTDSVRAGRIDLLTDGHRIKFVGATLRVVGISDIQPDTTIIFTVPVTEQTFIFDPPADPPADGMRVGGAPAWRTFLDVQIPTTLDGPPALCQTVGCPFTLGPEHVTYASLRLRSRASPQAFHPTDTIAMEIRAVLDKASLPKAPLGAPLGSSEGTPIAPEVFAAEGSIVDLPMTRYVQSYLAGPDPAGHGPPTTIAVLATPEPNEFSFGSFFGPGGPEAPVLNLVLTVSPPMEIR